MDDQLDNDLKKRIREVFENFGDTSADDGWLKLRKKFPEEERNRRAFAWIWWGAAAAVFFLFFGIFRSCLFSAVLKRAVAVSDLFLLRNSEFRFRIYLIFSFSL